MDIHFKPIAIVRNNRDSTTDDYWGDVVSEITLLSHIPEQAFNGIEDFSHLEIIYFFDRADKSKIVYSGRPRGNPEWPETGIFAQRKKDRPNQIGLCTVELIERLGNKIKVRNLDAINNTPVLDIKPVFKEFSREISIRQPEWVAQLMSDYWK